MLLIYRMIKGSVQKAKKVELLIYEKHISDYYLPTGYYFYNDNM